MACNPLTDPTCILDIPGQVLSSAAEQTLKTIADEVGAFAASLVKIVVTGWLHVPSPTVASSLDAALGGESTGAVAQLRAYTWWITAALAVGSVLIAAARIAWNRNGREAAELSKGLVQLVVLTGLGVPLVLLLTQVGDIYSSWIIDKSTQGGFEQKMGALTLIGGPAAATSGLSTIGVIVVGLILSFTLIIQILLMFGRAVGLVMLTGLVPVAAAGGMVGRSTQTRDRYLSWLIAFVLYKPAAATVYATGFWLIGDGHSLTDFFSGIMTFVIALVALPALMRLIAPAVETLSAGAGSGAMQGMALGTSLATGAVAVGSALGKGKGAGSQGGGDGDSQTAATGAAMAGAGPMGMVAGAAMEAGDKAKQTADKPRQVAATAGAIGATGAGGQQ